MTDLNTSRFYSIISILWLLLHCGLTVELTTLSNPPESTSTLGTIYRQARSEQQYYTRRYNGGNAPLMTGSIRSEPIEHRDTAYFESRCITCDPSKSIAPTDRSNFYPPRQPQRPRYDYYDDELDDRRYRDRYNPYYERQSDPYYENERYDPYKQSDPARTRPYYDRYEPAGERDRYYERIPERPYDRSYDRGYERVYERGNGYDNLDPRYSYDERSERPVSPRRPYPDEPYNIRYDRVYRNRYDRYDPYERSAWRRPYDERYNRYGARGPPPDARGYYSSSAWGPGYDRGYANAWNYSGARDNWKDVNADRDNGVYRPRDYFYDSTAAPGGSRGTNYHYDRTESSTKVDSTDRDKPTSSPQHQDNKDYKD